jgi:aspartyl-tRNA(Asn)/glutamyl-tRNA(Gln) amidotransferase subunit B
MVLTLTPEMSNFFDATVQNGADAKQASNWLMGEVSQYLNSEKVELKETALTPENLAGMINLIADGTISSKMGKKVFIELAKNGGDAKTVVEEKGFVQISDPAVLVPMINEILDNNEQSVADFKAGKDRATKALMGQIMKVSKGKANPAMVNKILSEELAKR